MRFLQNLALAVLVAGLFAFMVSVSIAAAKKPEGASIYAQKCSMCHGMEGKGYPAIKTPDFTDPKWQAAHTDKELQDAIANGVPGTAMVSFKGKLNKQQMEAVFKYIRSLGTKEKK
ncbi:MAG: c-type cytochrome [Acidobacteriota bacterium]